MKNDVMHIQVLYNIDHIYNQADSENLNTLEVVCWIV